MKTKIKKIVELFLLAVVLPSLVLAHQPRITSSPVTTVESPEISKAYYSSLKGDSQAYVITSDIDFDLYINILVPDIEGQKKDVSAVILKDLYMQKGREVQSIAILDGTSFQWKQMFEPFGYDNYWQGPEYKNRVQAGTYEVRVSSVNNDSKYSLVIGESEAFDMKESISAIKLIPQLKKDFFNESPADFALSPFGWGYILIMFILAFALGFLYRYIVRKFYKGGGNFSAPKNINKKDRIIRAVIGLALLALAITTTWNPILLLASGFCFFEAIFSWCALNQLMGKSTCPIE
jgi:Protein of unknown function (DUF2892)